MGAALTMLRHMDDLAIVMDIAICREIGDRRGEGQTLSNLGVTYLMLRRFDEAVSFYEHRQLLL